MSRLYSLTNVSAVTDAEHGHFEAGEDGGFDLPEEFAEKLHAFHLRGKPLWETDIERQNRLMKEELERRKDPTTLLSAVEQLVAAAKATTVLTQQADAEAKPAAKRPAKRAASTPAE